MRAKIILTIADLERQINAFNPHPPLSGFEAVVLLLIRWLLLLFSHVWGDFCLVFVLL